MVQTSDTSAYDKVTIRNGDLFREDLRDYLRVFWPRLAQVSCSMRPGVVLL